MTVFDAGSDSSRMRLPLRAAMPAVLVRVCVLVLAADGRLQPAGGPS